MSTKIIADELEREILLMEQEIVVKRAALEESRQKLLREIMEHEKTKSNLVNHLKENKDLKIQLDISTTATHKLEAENNKNRELLVKLQVQADTYLTERQQLLDRCYKAEVENKQLKDEIADLMEQLKAFNVLQENHILRQTHTENIVQQIISKQETLNKEVSRLETVCKEGLKFASKISEEAEFQAKFVRTANDCQTKMEEEMIRLMTVIRELESHKIRVLNQPENDVGYYIEEWKTYQSKTTKRMQEILKENKRLEEELNMATSEIELLLKNKF